MPLDFSGMKALDRSLAVRMREALKLLANLEEADMDEMTESDRLFYRGVLKMVEIDEIPTSEDQLSWLRDLCSKYT